MKTPKKRYWVTGLSICSVGLCAALLGSPNAASDIPLAFQGEITDSVCARAGSHDDMERDKGVKDSRDCVSECLKDGAVLVFRNLATGASYRLDLDGPVFNQDRLMEFAGAKVRIIGSLDENAALIWHIQSVQRL
jgi:hypothetical protein